MFTRPTVYSPYASVPYIRHRPWSSSNTAFGGMVTLNFYRSILSKEVITWLQTRKKQ
jgi:hypothetical protein